MRLRITTMAVVLLSALCCWAADANASCAGCPSGFECSVPPDLGFHYGSCVPVVESVRPPELTCYCSNNGQFRAEVKLYPCECLTESEFYWLQKWEQLSKGTLPPNIENWPELPEAYVPHPSVIMRWGVDKIAVPAPQTAGSRQCQ